MAAHYEIASEFFQQVLQKRRDEGDLTTPVVQRPQRVQRFWDQGEAELIFDPGDRPVISERDETPIAISYRTRKR